jgi:hypothetical protein
MDKKMESDIDYIGYYTNDLNVVVYTPNELLFNPWDTCHTMALVDSTNNILCKIKLENCRVCLGFNISENSIVYACLQYSDDNLDDNLYVKILFYSIINKTGTYEFIKTNTIKIKTNISCSGATGTLCRVFKNNYYLLWGDFVNETNGYLVLFNNINFINQESLEYVTDTNNNSIIKIPIDLDDPIDLHNYWTVSYTHLRAHETG